MISDIRTLSNHASMETDLCIIGGGAAGIAIAREFIGSSFNVILLESGGYEPDSEVQSLYEGEIVGEPYYRELHECRTRRFGGSTNCWGGMCTPMTEIDFQTRSWVPYSGWTVSYRELNPYFQRAHELCGVGPYIYDSSAWDLIGSEGLPFDPDLFLSHFWHINNRRGDRRVRFGEKFRADLKASSNVNVFLHANVTKLVSDEHGKTVQYVIVSTLQGKTARITAKAFVLASGGIENARLLLVSDDRHQGGIGNGRDLVGRFFHEHLHAPCAIVTVEDESSPISAYSQLWQLGRSHGLPGLTLSPKAQEEMQTLNASLSIDPVFDPQHAWVLARELRASLAKRAVTRKTAANFMRVLRVSGILVPDVYRRLAHGARPAGHPRRYTLYARAEQAPNPDSRIMLSSDTDRLGMRKVVMDWRTTALDRKAFHALTNLAKAEFNRLRLGRVQEEEWLKDGGWPANLEGGPHHMGTTRMSDSPSLGVVNRNCQVHGVEGLYVAGSSVFPTGGHANCTLTLLATTLRLADQLKSVLARESAATVDERVAATA